MASPLMKRVAGCICSPRNRWWMMIAQLVGFRQAQSPLMQQHQRILLLNSVQTLSMFAMLLPWRTCYDCLGAGGLF